MAANFEIVTARASTILVGTGDTMDVVETWVRALPSQVVYPIRLPDVSFVTMTVVWFADNSANIINTVFARGDVATMAHAQEVDEAGAIYDVMEVYVRSDNQALSERVTLPLSYFVPPFTGFTAIEPPPWVPPWDAINAALDAAAATLNAVAAL